MIPASVQNTLFGNVESIYDVNKEFFTRLQESKENIVSAFLTTAPFFKLYSVYAYNYKNVINMIEVSYPVFIVACTTLDRFFLRFCYCSLCRERIQLYKISSRNKKLDRKYAQKFALYLSPLYSAYLDICFC